MRHYLISAVIGISLFGSYLVFQDYNLTVGQRDGVSLDYVRRWNACERYCEKTGANQMSDGVCLCRDSPGALRIGIAQCLLDAPFTSCRSVVEAYCDNEQFVDKYDWFCKEAVK